MLAAASGGVLGCVERTVRITSEPSGALVHVNDREIGRTPLEFGFTYYGTYDLRVAKDGYRTFHGPGEASAPLWDYPGPDLVAEVLPVPLESRIDWHVDLEPLPDSPEDLLERAEAFRSEAGLAPAPARDDGAGG